MNNQPTTVPFINVYDSLNGVYFPCKLNPKYAQGNGELKYYGLRCNLTRQQVDDLKRYGEVSYFCKSKNETVQYSMIQGSDTVQCLLMETPNIDIFCMDVDNYESAEKIKSDPFFSKFPYTLSASKKLPHIYFIVRNGEPLKKYRLGFNKVFNDFEDVDLKRFIVERTDAIMYNFTGSIPIIEYDEIRNYLKVSDTKECNEYDNDIEYKPSKINYGFYKCVYDTICKCMYYDDYDKWVRMATYCKSMGDQYIPAFHEWAKRSRKYDKNENDKLIKNAPFIERQTAFRCILHYIDTTYISDLKNKYEHTCMLMMSGADIGERFCKSNPDLYMYDDLLCKWYYYDDTNIWYQTNTFNGLYYIKLYETDRLNIYKSFLLFCKEKDRDEDLLNECNELDESIKNVKQQLLNKYNVGENKKTLKMQLADYEKQLKEKKKDMNVNTEDYDKKISVITDYIRKLGGGINTSIYSGIIEQSLKMMYVKRQINKIFEKNVHLFAFNNCLIDTTKQCNHYMEAKRQIQPTDYIVMSTGYDLQEPNKNDIDEVNKMIDDIYYKRYELIDDEQERETFMKKQKDYREYSIFNYAQCLNGERNEQKVYFMQGRGRNGKSVMANLVKTAFGNYYDAIDSSLLCKEATTRGQHLEGIANKIYKRIVMNTDIDADKDKDTLQNGMIKGLTEKHFKARECGSKEVDILIQFKLFILCNDIPQYKNRNDIGAVRRNEIHPSQIIFDDNPKHAHQRKTNYETVNKSISRQWGDAFIHILLESYWKYRNNKPELPEIIDTATKLNNIGENTYELFKNIYMVEDPKSVMYAKDIYDKYMEFCHYMKQPEPKNINSFSQKMDKFGFDYGEKTNKGRPYYVKVNDENILKENYKVYGVKDYKPLTNLE